MPGRRKPGCDRCVRFSAPAHIMIRVKSLEKTFVAQTGGTVAALGPLDLAIADGEFVCVVGPSGCGKSTMLRILAGLERATAGGFEIRSSPGHVDDVVTASDARPTVASPLLVFQGDSTFPWMTVSDNVGYGLRMRGVPQKDRDADVARMLAVVGLSSFGEAYPHQLSGGMKQRVALARAWVSNSPILLMDEPFGALDEQTRLSLQNQLLAIWDNDSHTFAQASSSKKTILFVTHSIEEAITLGDRVLVMSERPGAIKAEIVVPFARPRDAMHLKRDPAFGELGFKVWQLLAAGADAG